MKITSIEPIKLRFFPKTPLKDGLAGIPSREVFLVQVHTDEGIVGLGEGFALGMMDSLEAITMETLAPMLIGADPLKIEHLWTKMYLGTARYGRRGIMMAAISAVDIALWDILGKSTGMPVYRLLGAAHDSLTPYASAGYYMDGKGLAELRAEFRGYKEQGFCVMKMKVGAASPLEDARRIAAVREELGDDGQLGVDANNAWGLSHSPENGARMRGAGPSCSWKSRSPPILCRTRSAWRPARTCLSPGMRRTSRTTACATSLRRMLWISFRQMRSGPEGSRRPDAWGSWRRAGASR